MLFPMEPTVTNPPTPTASATPATKPSVRQRLAALTGGIGAWQRAGGEIR
jgi:hypothetical protein